MKKRVSDFFRNNKRIWIDLAWLFGALVFITVSYLVFKPYYRIPNVVDGLASRIYIYTLILAWIITGIFLYKYKKLNMKTLLCMLFVMAVILRVAYMLITPYNYRQHDTVTPYGDGHENYAWIIYETGGLPETNVYQFYHPPLTAFLQSCWMHCFKPFLEFSNLFLDIDHQFDTSSMHVMFESTQIMTCMFMVLLCYFVIKIFYHLDVNKIAKIFGVCFVIFFPRLVQFAAQENNDPICVFFCFLTIYFTFRYYYQKSWFNVMGIAVSVGLAMMAKLSGAIIALLPAVFFILDFYKSIKENKKTEKGFPMWADLLIKYSVLLVVSFALGFWFQIYAKVRFDQPIGYVYPISEESDLYHGDVNFFNRFINIFEFNDFYRVVYGNTFINYNLFNFTIRSALFGEFNFMNADVLAIFSSSLNYLFVLLALFNFIIYMIRPDKKNFLLIVAAITIIVTQYGAQLFFNIRYPFGCTMDFRYIVPIVFGFGIMQTINIDRFIHEKNWKGIVTLTSTILGSLMILSTVIFYLIII